MEFTLVLQFLKEDYTIYEAASAERGLAWLKQSEPDIIVCDVVMQGMSGVEFCAMLKDSKESAYIPVILLTGTSSPEIKLKGIECGADDYITKPFEKELLTARIKGILKGRDSLKRYFFNEVTLQNNNEKVSEEYSLFLAQCMEPINKHLQDEEFNVKVFVKEMGLASYLALILLNILRSTDQLFYVRAMPRCDPSFPDFVQYWFLNLNL